MARKQKDYTGPVIIYRWYDRIVAFDKCGKVIFNDRGSVAKRYLLDNPLASVYTDRGMIDHMAKRGQGRLF